MYLRRACVFVGEAKKAHEKRVRRVGARVGKLEIHICTKTKCTNRTVEVKVRRTEAAPAVHTGLTLLAAARKLVAERRLGGVAEVRAAACMSSCPVGPRLDLMQDGTRVRYIKRQRPTGRPDFVTWGSIDSIEDEIQSWLGASPHPAGAGREQEGTICG